MAKQQTSKAMVLDATQVLAKIQGAASDPERVNNRLALAADRFNLLSPATSVGQLPEATAVALSVVYVDRRLTKDGGDCWAIGGGLMPAKHKVMQFCGALGISWDPTYCGRIDDGSDPHYCKWKAVGRYRRFDGMWQTVVAHKQMDLRDGSPMIQKLEKDAAKYNKPYPEKQIIELRGFIEEHAETKAMLRAIRAAAGMKTSYTRDELAKPFVVASLQVTGQTDDPVLRRMFMEEMLHGGQRAFGPAPAAAPAPAALPAAQLEAPPPVGSVPVDEEDEPAYEPEPPRQQQQQHVVARQPQPKAAPPPPPEEPAPAPAPAAGGSGDGGDNRPLICPGGDHKGKSWPELPDDALIYWHDNFSKILREDRAKNPERMQRHLNVMQQVLDGRGLLAPDDEPPPPEEPDEY